MTIEEYLTSPQAEEDVRELLAQDRPLDEDGGPDWRHHGRWGDLPMEAWIRVSMTWAPDPAKVGKVHYVYYRRDSDGRFTVTDLGESVQSLRRRRGCIWDLPNFRNPSPDSGIAWDGPGGDIICATCSAGRSYVARENLSRAICAVLREVCRLVDLEARAR